MKKSRATVVFIIFMAMLLSSMTGVPLSSHSFYSVVNAEDKVSETTDETEEQTDETQTDETQPEETQPEETTPTEEPTEELGAGDEDFEPAENKEAPSGLTRENFCDLICSLLI